MLTKKTVNITIVFLSDRSCINKYAIYRLSA